MYVDPITLSNQSNYAPGLIQLTEEQFAVYIEYNGFIKITRTDPVEIEPDTEAWEAWKAQEAENPQPTEQPTNEERISALESAMLTMMLGV